MMKHIVRFMKEEEGTTAVEYGLMLALIGAALIAAVTGLGNTISTRLTNVSGIIAS